MKAADEIKTITDDDPVRFTTMVNEAIACGWSIVNTFIGASTDQEYSRIFYAAILARYKLN